MGQEEGRARGPPRGARPGRRAAHRVARGPHGGVRVRLRYSLIYLVSKSDLPWTSIYRGVEAAIEITPLSLWLLLSSKSLGNLSL